MADITWKKVLNSSIELNVQTLVISKKGNLVYEYNPFRNYRLTLNMYEYKDDLYSVQELQDNFGLYLSTDKKDWQNSEGTKLDMQNPPILRESGELVDFITNGNELSFDLNHPVSIIPLYSYDGSVNLILNDGVNTPKLINSRFSATGKNTYEIIDRKGNNDTNIYDLGEEFKIDTSLYKSVYNIPKIIYKGCSSGGNLKIGNYFFYFKLADADGNETDFVGESGLVSVFMGFDDPDSVHTGLKNENSFKSVSFILSNIDISYDYVNVYYSRSTAEGNDNPVTDYVKIDKKFPVDNLGQCKVVISGDEPSENISAADINLDYQIVDSAKALATCQNRLFLGNVHKPEIPYEELADLSLRFLPFLKLEEYPLLMDENYNITSISNGYYDDKFIYEKTGYWAGELYRLGVVYIMPNGELSPVFNIRGAIDIPPYTPDYFLKFDVYSEDGSRNIINYNELTYYIENSKATNENVKGVVRFKATVDTNTIHALDIRVDEDTIAELRKYVKGYFFVRLKRIPTILALGVTMGIDQESHTPMVATADGLLTKMINTLLKTHVETEDIKDVNYISEGFLSRYLFYFKKKSSGLWGSLITAIAVIAIAVAAVYTCGAAALAIGTVFTKVAMAATIGKAIVASALTAYISAGVLVTTATVMANAAAILEIRYGLSRTFDPLKLDGRNTKCPTGYTIEESDESRRLTLTFEDRIIIKDPSKVKVLAIICPEYELNQPYYNQIFTGNEHIILLTNSANINYLSGHSSNYFTESTDNFRHFYIPSYYDRNITTYTTSKIIPLADSQAIVGMGKYKFRGLAGSTEEAYKYEYVGTSYKDNVDNLRINSDIIRGSFGPYLAILSDSVPFYPAEIVNIYIPKFSFADINKYIENRMSDSSVYYTISERFDINNLSEYYVSQLSKITNVTTNKDVQHSVYRGDCYICQFTHRVNRNFNAPSAPYNDEIVDPDTWKNNYDPDETEKYADINLGDVNAIKLGMWVTFRIRSSRNLNIRTLDNSNIDEKLMSGHGRGYYPNFPMSVDGVYKKPESQVINNGFNVKQSDRWHFEVPDVPYIKNWFGTRIIYSDIHVNDAFLNGFRTFKGQNYRDYTREYGEITKLISLNSNLLCVFEHGIALIPVNERTIAGNGSGGMVYINTNKVLPDNPRIISNTFGSQWADSILKVPTVVEGVESYVYGVDTVAKKIWRTDGRSLECISDFKVQEFLNNNITLGERELTPILGIRNVKTFYNAYKHDVMFTFYDNTYGFLENVWNLCWNELMNGGKGLFVTFYSWVPSFMENINNVPFSFDRNVSKWIAKLGTTHNESSFADGITLTNVLVNNYFIDDDGEENATTGQVVDDFSFTVDVLLANGEVYKEKLNLADYTYDESIADTVDKFKVTKENHLNSYIGVLGIQNRVLPETTMFYKLNYVLERDSQGNYKNFEIAKIGRYKIPTKIGDDITTTTKYPGEEIDIYALYFKNTIDPQEAYSPLYISNDIDDDNLMFWADIYGNYSSVDGEAIDVNWENYPKREDRIFCQHVNEYGPEKLMTELYYRNLAGHKYSDTENNKIKYTILQGTSYDGALDPTEYYNIYEVVQYVIDNWFKQKLDNMDMLSPGYLELSEKITHAEELIAKIRAKKEDANAEDYNKLEAYNLGKWLLKEEGGPFDPSALVYLGTPPNLWACSGGLGHLVTHPSSHAPFEDHYILGSYMEEVVGTRKKILDLPIFKNMKGLRPMLPDDEKINADKIVTQLLIRADISINDDTNKNSVSDAYYNLKANFINAGYYESAIAVTTKWNMQFLTSDFWKHGQAGIIDIADDIYPTYWYGKQHPFEFECIVVDDPSVHKIFTNLEIVANKAKPESFHYEVIGEAYDFAKDKANMYFRQEAIKALWLYNGSDIQYNRNFLKIEPKQNPKSADIIRTYYARKLSLNDIESYYRQLSNAPYDYDHLSGGEISYYPTRLEFRIWNHTKAVDVDDMKDTSATSFGGRGLLASNMRYLEDKWYVTINPLIVVYKNEYLNGLTNTTWASNYSKEYYLPLLPLYNSPIPDEVKNKGTIDFPGFSESLLDKENALYQLYDLTDYGKLIGTDPTGVGIYNYSPLDLTNWLNDSSIYGTSFGAGQNRRETDIRDKFMKVRIRYSGEELAVIDWLNTIYQISYA